MAKTTNGDLQIVNFTVDDVNYGVPVEQVREVRDMQQVTRVPGAPDYVNGVTNLRGQIITVVDLRKRLGLADVHNGSEKISLKKRMGVRPQIRHAYSLKNIGHVAGKPRIDLSIPGQIQIEVVVHMKWLV
jgi:chemotaxis signal transduction protein